MKEEKPLSFFKLMTPFLKTIFSIREETQATDIILMWNHSPYEKLNTIMSTIKANKVARVDSFINLKPSTSLNSCFFNVKMSLCRTFKDTRLRILKYPHYENIDVSYFLQKAIQERNEKLIVLSNDSRYVYCINNNTDVAFLSSLKEESVYTFEYANKDNSKYYSTIKDLGINPYEGMILTSLFYGDNCIFKPYTEYKPDTSFGEYLRKMQNYGTTDSCIKDFQWMYDSLDIREKDNSILKEYIDQFLKQVEFNDNQAYGFLLEVFKPLGHMYFELVQPFTIDGV